MHKNADEKKPQTVKSGVKNLDEKKPAEAGLKCVAGKMLFKVVRTKGTIKIVQDFHLGLAEPFNFHDQIDRFSGKNTTFGYGGFLNRLQIFFNLKNEFLDEHFGAGFLNV